MRVDCATFAASIRLLERAELACPLAVMPFTRDSRKQQQTTTVGSGENNNTNKKNLMLAMPNNLFIPAIDAGGDVRAKSKLMNTFHIYSICVPHLVTDECEKW